MKEKTIFVVSIITSLFVGIIGTILVIQYVPIKTEVIEKTVAQITATDDNTIKSAISKVYDAVVVVEAYQNNQLIGTGTGFVYKKDDNNGYLITNHHVTEDARTVKVLNNNGQEVEAKVLGSDEYADIAVLSIDASAVMQVAEIGESSASEIGDSVFTVGSPLGTDYIGTVTKGILSGKDRTVEVELSNNNTFMMEVLQTDAAINPGNSGGPLVNMNGEVIGVNSMKLVEDKIEGMGFAIPIELVMSAVERLENGEAIERPLIGASLMDADNTYGLFYNKILLDDSITSGTVIVSVEEGYPAQAANLQKGDVILEVNGTKIKNTAHFRSQLYKYSIGDTITLKINRDGKEMEVNVLLTRSATDE